MFNKETYVRRRRELAKKVGNGIILILGNVEAPTNYPDNTYKFRQDSSFLYFFGLYEPGLAAVIDTESGEEVIFGNDVDIDDIIWMGPQPLMAEKAKLVGVDKTAPLSKLAEYIGKQNGRKIHFLPPYRYANKILLHQLLEIPFEKMKESASMELINAVISLRMVKDAEEIAELDKAANIGYAMHYTVMKMAKLGMVEQELVGIMEGIAASQGRLTSFATILSQNGETLHNHTHHQVLTAGSLLVIDAGAETNMGYASDFTRTIPTSGKFTNKQKDIYNIVCGANNLAYDLSAPGVTYKEVHLKTCRFIAQGLKDLGLMMGDVDEAVANGAHALFMPHGLGHNMGLDVHDMEDLGQIYVGYDEVTRPSDQFGLASLRMGRELKPGYVVTDEPGCYFIPALIEKWKNEGINTPFINFEKLKEYYNFGGIRLEDDLLITENGRRRLGSKRLPITATEVEETMQK